MEILNLLSFALQILERLRPREPLPEADPRPQIDDNGLVLRNFGPWPTNELSVFVRGPNVPGSSVEETLHGGLSSHGTGLHNWRLGWTRETIDEAVLVLNWKDRRGKAKHSRWRGAGDVVGGFVRV